MKIFVTGYGAISAIGKNVREIHDSLLKEKTGIRQGKKSHTSRFLVGEIDETNHELAENYGLSRNQLSRTSILGCIAAKEAFEGHDVHSSIRTGVISGTSVGGMDVSEQQYQLQFTGQTHDVSQYQEHPSGMTAQDIADELGIFSYINTISTACSSAANAIMLGARMLKNDQLDRVIVGSTDALSLFTINGFRSLMIFDDQWCRPFDESRAGLNLGEGAGFLVLESENCQRVTQKPILAELTGWSNASDAYHQTASSPEGDGAVLAMTEALKVANLSTSEISYINAHGTATPNNDLSESHAIKRVFGANIPPFSSTKAYTGHTLAASGGIEAVISVLAINNGELYPNLNHRQVIQETGLQPLTHVQSGISVNHVLSNSFGFGGNNSTLIFSKA